MAELLTCSSSLALSRPSPDASLKRAGYREIGIERQHRWRDGGWHDHWLCEVLREDRGQAHER